MRGLSLRERVTKIMMMAKCEGALRSLGPLSGGRSGAKGRGVRKGVHLESILYYLLGTSPGLNASAASVTQGPLLSS